MPAPKDTTMLRLSSQKVLIAMAEKEYTPVELAEASGVSVNTVYTMRRGFYTKPKYIGRVAHALGVKVADLVADEERGQGTNDNTGEVVAHTAESESS
ncbi:MAG: helix-turn-helix transcriptional regulator [Lachnospiraceae bacterium]|nr:helix-turn-helix transcriptional regulator [Lachnospiraceae bacterium]